MTLRLPIRQPRHWKREKDVIEVKLPAGWPAPTPYNFNLSNKLEAADGTLLADALKDKDIMGPHAYLSGSISRLEGAEISVINDDGTDAFDAGGELDDTVSSSDGWFVRIVIGSKGVSKNGTIVLKYNDVTVQRRLTIDDPELASYDPASVEVFSGPSATVALVICLNSPLRSRKSRGEVRSRRFWCGHV